MKKLLSLLSIFSMAVALNSCEKDDSYIDPNSLNNSGISGVYVLNYGTGYNDSTLSFFNSEMESTTEDIFYPANNRLMGSGANDMVAYGEKLFITVTGSNIIYVTNLKGVVLKEIVSKEYKDPRNIILSNGKIYVTYFNSTDSDVATGGVMMIDPATYETTSAAAGNKPEGLAVAYGKLYVANSGYGSGTTLSTYDPATLKFIKDVTVPQNPNWLAATEDGSKLFLLTLGTYKPDYSYDELPQIHSIANDGTATALTSPEGENPGEMAMSIDGKLQVICGVYDKGFNYNGGIYTYNTTSGALEGEFVSDKTTITNPYKISANITTGEVALLTKPKGSLGSTIVFDKDGKQTRTFKVGYSPIKACFVK